MLLICSGLIYCFSLFCLCTTDMKKVIIPCVSSLLFAGAFRIIPESFLIFPAAGVLLWLAMTLLSGRNASDVLHIAIAFSVLATGSNLLAFYVLQGLIPAFLFIHFTDYNTLEIFQLFSACLFQLFWTLYIEAAHLRIADTSKQAALQLICVIPVSCCAAISIFRDLSSNQLYAGLNLLCIFLLMIGFLLKQYFIKHSDYLIEKQNAILMQNELQTLRTLQNRMMKSIHDTYTLRHDMKNMMIMIQAEIAAGRYSEAERMR